MLIKFICTYEGWVGSYVAKCAPRIGEDITFPGKTGQYLVTAVKHEVVKANNVRRDEPDVRVYVRPRGAGIERKSLRRLAGGHHSDPELYVLDPEAEKRRVAELTSGDYRE